MKRTMLAAAVLLGISGGLLAALREVHGSAAPACRVQGVWDMTSYSFKGRTEAVSGAKQRKIVTRNHYMWLQMDSLRDTIPLTSALDSARHFAMSGGSGRYRVAGNKYTERLEYFVDPKLLGKELTATCRTEGRRWYHTYLLTDLFPEMQGVSQRDSSTEVYIRVE
jgi:hypothetical protein